jgi:hypothetical protein
MAAEVATMARPRRTRIACPTMALHTAKENSTAGAGTAARRPALRPRQAGDVLPTPLGVGTLGTAQSCGLHMNQTLGNHGHRQSSSCLTSATYRGT